MKQRGSFVPVLDNTMNTFVEGKLIYRKADISDCF